MVWRLIEPEEGSGLRRASAFEWEEGVWRGWMGWRVGGPIRQERDRRLFLVEGQPGGWRRLVDR